MISDGDDKITKLPVRFKNALPEERSLAFLHEVGKRQPCNHLFATYLIGDGDAEVTCGRCDAKLDPMWVLHKLAIHDRRMAENTERYRDETKRLAERSRTKCDHCGKMTRISRR